MGLARSALESQAFERWAVGTMTAGELFSLYRRLSVHD